MNIIDITIIYLACGAPFGVYYYFQQRETANLWQNSPMVLLKCVIVTFFWLPFALQLFNKSINKRLLNNEFAVKNQTDSTKIKEIEHFEKVFLQKLLETESRISPFEFRQTFDRYVGLTLNNLPESINQNFGEFEFFKIANHQNPKLATICLQRRNRLHLRQHQINARSEILRIFEILKKESVNTEQIYALTAEFSKVMDDSELELKINQLFDKSLQNQPKLPVNILENEVWKTPKQKPRPTTQPTLNLPPMHSTTMMSKHD